MWIEWIFNCHLKHFGLILWSLDNYVACTLHIEDIRVLIIHFPNVHFNSNLCLIRLPSSNDSVALVLFGIFGFLMIYWIINNSSNEIKLNDINLKEDDAQQIKKITKYIIDSYQNEQRLKIVSLDQLITANAVKKKYASNHGKLVTQYMNWR